MTAAAFFDVDGTVTGGVGLFRFLRFHLAAEGRGEAAYAAHLERLRALREAGRPREETNRVHYEVYAGARAAAVAETARRWLAAELDAGGLLNPAVVRAVRAHRRRGEPVVLVSGSFPAPLAPLGEHLGAAHVLCTEPEIDSSGVYTGRLADGPHQPMIGAAKAAAVRALAAAEGYDLAASTAYGDHVSDLPLLEAAGAAAVVGEDPAMAERAERSGWRRLPGLPEPPPLPLR